MDWKWLWSDLGIVLEGQNIYSNYFSTCENSESSIPQNGGVIDAIIFPVRHEKTLIKTGEK
jgi:hypothetical protein